MRRFAITITFCFILSGCERGIDAGFSDLELPIADSARTYHGPGGDTVIRINKGDTLRIETRDGHSYVEPAHDAAVEILRSARDPKKYPRVHIFVDRRATVGPILRAYEMIEESGIDVYIFAVNFEGNAPNDEYLPVFAMGFDIPPPEIRAQLVDTNP